MVRMRAPEWALRLGATRQATPTAARLGRFDNPANVHPQNPCGFSLTGMAVPIEGEVPSSNPVLPEISV